ncbi:serine protease hepsin-like, partial [Dendropsophus ebraccatus]|uniref:serine protease hepsin-like n=1 Tax=Dendropsophus ebraccatus TaxID=150705 RepID=UPI00383193F3
MVQKDVVKGCPWTPLRILAVTTCILISLAGIGITIWAVVTYVLRNDNLYLYAVQVNSPDYRLSVFDEREQTWRLVCSSMANEEVATLSCEEMGFIRSVSHQVIHVEIAGTNGTLGYYCIQKSLLSSAKRLQDVLTV